MAINKTWINLAVAVGVVVTFGAAITQMFGTTVSAKFHDANNGVVNNVVFGDFGPADQNHKWSGPTYVEQPVANVWEPQAAQQVAQHTDHGTHPVLRAAVDAVSTFSVDVDTASYGIARRALENGMLPAPESIRVEEFVNAFTYADKAPTEEALIAYLEAAPSPVSIEPNTYLMRVAVKAADLGSVTRKPWNLVYLVDVSGSMMGDDRIGLLKAAMLESLRHLQPTDTVSIVTYAGRTEVALQPTSAANADAIRHAIHTLETGGGTDMGSGLELAYGLAAKTTQEGAMGRVVVMSDGDANIGATGYDQMLQQIEQWADKGIKMTTVGVGDRFNDTNMEQLANKGDGSYVYLDGLSQVKKTFGDELPTWMQDVASDAKIQVEFDPSAVATWRQIGYENRAMADSEFRNDARDAGEIGLGHNVTALYEVTLTGTPSDELATVRLRYRPEGASNHIEREVLLNSKDVKTRLDQASDDLKFSAAVASFALMLKRAPESKHVTPELIEELLVSAKGDRAVEFAKLVKKTRNLWAGRL